MVVDEPAKDFSRTHKVDLCRSSPSDVEAESVSHGGGSLAVVGPVPSGMTCGNVVDGGWQMIAVCELLADCVRTAGSGRRQATESKWSLSPRALATFMT